MKHYWDRVEIGDRLPELLVDHITRLQSIRFAAATSDFSPFYFDEDSAAKAGYQSILVPHTVAVCLLEEALHTHATNSNLNDLRITFLRLIWPKDSLTTKGVVLRRYIHHGDHRIDIRVWVENQLGEVVLKGYALVTLFKNEDHEKREKTSSPKPSKENLKELCARALELAKKQPRTSKKIVSELA